LRATIRSTIDVIAPLSTDTFITESWTSIVSTPCTRSLHPMSTGDFGLCHSLARRSGPDRYSLRVDTCNHRPLHTARRQVPADGGPWSHTPAPGTVRFSPCTAKLVSVH
jgi:hypothetical protein